MAGIPLEATRSMVGVEHSIMHRPFEYRNRLSAQIHPVVLQAHHYSTSAGKGLICDQLGLEQAPHPERTETAKHRTGNRILRDTCPGGKEM